MHVFYSWRQFSTEYFSSCCSCFQVVKSAMPDRANNPSGSVQLEDIIGDEPSEKQALAPSGEER